MSEGPAWSGPGELPDGAVVPQHLVLILPSTGEFDSRSYRIARELLGRGHRVTMVARWQRGLATEELDPIGYRIIRVPVSTEAGLPFPAVMSAGRRVIRAFHDWRVRRRRGSGPAAVPSVSAAPDRASAAPASGTPTAAPSSGATVPPTAATRRASAPRRAWSAMIRRLAIPLAIRSHIRSARQLAPAGDLYHGMAYMGIPVALDLGRRAHVPVVYDARDIYLQARNLARASRLARWYAARSERGWAHRADAVITVNDAYATVIAESLRIPRPLVVMNCSYRFDPPTPRERRFHVQFDLDPSERIVLYHGGLFPHRGIEELMTAIATIDGATLVLMGYGVLEPEFRARAAEPGLVGRVRLMGAVPPADLLDWVACADVVAIPIQPSTLNHRLTTPNKLFEAMAAGVPSVVTDLPGMAPIVRETGCGILVDPDAPSEIGDAIRTILALPPEEWEAWRRRCLQAAHSTYNWETQVGRLLEVYGRLTGRPW